MLQATVHWESHRNNVRLTNFVSDCVILLSQSGLTLFIIKIAGHGVGDILYTVASVKLWVEARSFTANFCRPNLPTPR
jgi:hypothetical protein